MRALLLAGGLGTRLRPLTNATPKCLVPIRGKPLLGYWFDLLFSNGIEQVLVNTHHLPERVREFVAKSRWRNRVFLTHEDFLLGTGGTVLRNGDFFGNNAFIVAHADNLTCFDFWGFVMRHHKRPEGAHVTMMTFTSDDPKSCGIVEQDERGMVTAFHEKSPLDFGNCANAAVYIFEPLVLRFLAGLGKEVIDLSTEFIPRYLRHICTFHNSLYHRDIGTPESLAAAEREFDLICWK